jgi:hypothetical protein
MNKCKYNYCVNRPKQNLYIRFYYASFLDLAFAKSLTLKNPRNSIELVEYKSYFLQQSLEKLFKAILLNNDRDCNYRKFGHDLVEAGEEISKEFGNDNLKFIINKIYKNNLSHGLSAQDKSRLLNEVKKFFPGDDEAFIFFKHLCFSLNESFFAIRYPEKVSQKVELHEVLRGTDIILQTIIDVHNKLLKEYFNQSSLKKMIVRVYRGKYRGYLSFYQKAKWCLITFFSQTQEDMIKKLIIEVFK